MKHPSAAVLAAMLAGALFTTTACRDSVSSERPPVAEFLLAAGDSTYWIRSSADGIRVRSAPILLTVTDNRIYEIFIADDVHDFEQASFASARIWGRDITRNDSLLVFADDAVARAAREWIRRHPKAVPLDPSDLDPDVEPPTIVSDDIEVIEVHGPWITIEYSLDVDIAGRADHEHRRLQRVVDVRDGTRVSLQTLFGPDEEVLLAAAARRALVELKDSVLRSTDERSIAARRTLDSFRFDSLSFGLTDVDGAPAVAFLVPGSGDDGEALALYLPPLKAGQPLWWSAIQETLPVWNGDSTVLTWRRPSYRVNAQPTADGEQLAIDLITLDESRAVRHWAIATVPSPTYQLIALDTAPLDSALRVALARAFDQSSALNGRVQRASFDWPSASPYWRRWVAWSRSKLATWQHRLS